MILDTTYFLPLVGIKIRENLLLDIDLGRINLRFEDVSLSLITIFELQAKATKLKIPPERIFRGVRTIINSFNIIPFYEERIIKIASELKEMLNDYIDCIILATAISSKEGLITEDEDILGLKDQIKKKYKIEVLSYNQLTRQ
mgnify:CR=1 FL=1